MGTALAQTTETARLITPEAAAKLQALRERAAGYVRGSVAANTAKAYRSDWRHFATWADGYGIDPLPASPETVALYFSDIAETHKPATITRRMAAIKANHEAAGYVSPTGAASVRKVLAGIRRDVGTAQRRAHALTVEDVQRIVRELAPAGTLGARDRALVLVGFGGAFRRSELVGIQVEHVAFVTRGVVITLPRSKTDQEGAGQPVFIPYTQDPETCPVRALRAWLTAAGITSGPVFRQVDRGGHVGDAALTAQVVALIVKRYAKALGYDPADYSGHSLRAGLATSAAAAGVPSHDIRRQTRHKSEAMLAVYIREADGFARNPVSALGL